MKLTYRIIFALTITFTFLLSSCEDVIDVDLRTAEPELVIEGNVVKDSLATVRLTKTKAFAEPNNYTTITDAVVRIRDDVGNSELLHVNDTGVYITEFIRGQELITYHMSVEYEGKEYTASSKMPPVVEIDSITFFKMAIIDYPFPMVHMTDPEGPENDYYKLFTYVNGDKANDGEYVLFSFENMDALPIHQIMPLFNPDDDDDDDPIKPGDELMIEIQCVDYGPYLFWETLDRINNSLVNPTSNINGGALGYFSAYSKSRIKTTVPNW